MAARLQRQRRFILQPRIGPRHESLPWVFRTNPANPESVQARGTGSGGMETADARADSLSDPRRGFHRRPTPTARVPDPKPAPSRTFGLNRETGRSAIRAMDRLLSTPQETASRSITAAVRMRQPLAPPMNPSILPFEHVFDIAPDGVPVVKRTLLIRGLPLLPGTRCPSGVKALFQGGIQILGLTPSAHRLSRSPLSFPNSIWERPWEGNSISQAGVSAGRRAAPARRHPLHAMPDAR